ncbi:MAG: LemA family protein, partial [Pseudomonadales bacterium]|nr:LemA family protein [Pseudomonadales bacterium]
NTGVVAKKQVGLINQLIDVVKSYQESEKLVVMKVSGDISTAASMATMHQQSGMVLATVNGLAQRFPDLKANDQYQRLIDSIQRCEHELENVRRKYNTAVRNYNTRRSRLPEVLFANSLGFKAAPYLEFQQDDPNVSHIGSMQSFATDEDGERLNQLLGVAGTSAKKLGERALSGSKDLAAKALEGGKALVGQAQEKVKQIAEDIEARQTAARQFHYIDKDKNPAGPVSQSELHRLFAEELITPETLVLAAGSTQWVAYRQVMEQTQW